DVGARATDQIDVLRGYRAVFVPTRQGARQPIHPGQHLPKDEIAGPVMGMAVGNSQVAFKRDGRPREAGTLCYRPGVVEAWRKKLAWFEHRVLFRMQWIVCTRFRDNGRLSVDQILPRTPMPVVVAHEP